MAKKQRIDLTDDLKVTDYHIVPLHDGTWGVSMDVQELNAEGKMLRELPVYVDMPAKIQTQWEKVVAALDQLAKYQRGLDDEAEVSNKPAKTIAARAAAKGTRKR